MQSRSKEIHSQWLALQCLEDDQCSQSIHNIIYLLL